jgi:hypothetical protein
MADNATGVVLAPGEEYSGWPKPGRWRRFGAFYLDLWVSSALVHTVGFFMGFQQYRWPIAFALTLVLEFSLYGPLSKSFGRYALAIVDTPKGPRVDPELKSGAHWIIVLLGFLWVMDSHKLLVRGFDIGFYHFFGNRLEGTDARLLLITMASGYLFVANGLFRLKSHAPWSLIALGAFMLLNDALSLPVLTEYAAAYKSQREALRGRPLPMSAEQFAYFRMVMGAVLVILFATVALVFRRRFKHPGWW